MSKIQEKIDNKNQIFQSLSNKDNLKNFYLKELKTTHSGGAFINYNDEYLKERHWKLKEEINVLKQKILSTENKNSSEKNNLEKIILSLREDNHFLKQNYEIQNANINKLSKEKEKLLNEINDLHILNNNLMKDKGILLEQIKELNDMINNDILPKLKKNENNFKFMENKINDLQKMIISLKNEKTRMLDDNNNKTDLIKILTKQNKKLLSDIKLKYKKDLSFIESIEKYEIENNINKDIYREMINKYDNDNNKFNNNINGCKIMNCSYENDIENKDIKIKKKSFDKKYYRKLDKTEIEA